MFVVFALSLGCASQPQISDGTTQASQPVQAKTLGIILQPFTESIDGTTVSFDMVAVNITKPNPDSKYRPVPSPFWIAETEVTWDLYDLFTYGLDRSGTEGDPDVDAVTRPSKPYISMDRGFGRSGYPVISVSYHGAQTFCKWLSEKTGKNYRLPTEAQWTLVCETGGAKALTNPAQHSWFADNADYKTHEVATKKANKLGLYDLYGNASEWCITVAGNGVTMGGSYQDGADAIGCKARVKPTKDWNALDPQIPKGIWWLTDAGFVGLRVVCIPSTEDEGASDDK